MLLSLCCFCTRIIIQARESGKKHLSINYNTFPSDSSRFASAYNHPVFGLGVSVADFSRVRLTNQSSINNIYVFIGTSIKAHDFRMAEYLELSLGYKF
jgi:hypothetical protein